MGGILRVWCAVELYRSYSPIQFPSPHTDMATYLELGAAVRDGSFAWQEGFYYQPFYYTVVVPLGLALGGIPGLIGLQILFSCLTVALVGHTAGLLFGRRAGLLAAACLALHRMSMFYVPVALIATVQTFWMALLAWLGVACYRRPGRAKWLLLGVVTGLAIVTRGNALLFVPLCLALVAWRSWPNRKALSVGVALYCLGLMLPQLPYSIQNYRVTGEWVGASTAGGNVLALGNTPEAPPGGRDAHTGAGPMAYPASYDDWTTRAKLDGPLHRTVQDSILNWASREPLAFAELKLRMLLLFCHRSEIPNNVALTDAKGRWAQSAAIRLPVLVDFWLLGTLGLAGILLALLRRRRPAVLFCAALAVTYAGSIVLFYVLARFRLPVLPLVAVFAGYAIDQIYRLRKRRDRKQVYTTLGALVAAAILVLVGFDYYRLTLESTMVRLTRPHGVQLDLLTRHQIQDHGPMEFGGWQPIPAQGSWRKDLRLPPGVEGSGLARIACISPQPRTIRLAGQPYDLEAGLNWLSFEPAATGEEVMAIAFTVEAPEGVQLVIDTQRNYRRTIHNGQTIPAELVLEYRVVKPNQ